MNTGRSSPFSLLESVGPLYPVASDRQNIHNGCGKYLESAKREHDKLCIYLWGRPSHGVRPIGCEVAGDEGGSLSEFIF